MTERLRERICGPCVSIRAMEKAAWYNTKWAQMTFDSDNLN